MRSRCIGRTRNAFTLTELVVVLAISTLLLVSVSLLLRAPLRIARWQASVEAIRLADSQARATCRNQGVAGVLEINSLAQTIVWYTEKETETKHRVSLFGLNRIRTNAGTSQVWKSKIDRWGRSESYAVQIGPPSTGQWHLFAGVTGQATTFDNEELISSILEKISKSPLAD